MARTITAMTVFAFLAFAVLARADQAALREAAGRNGYSTAEADAIERSIEQAAAAGIPLEPIVKKAFEGVSKRVPAQSIVRVLSGQLERAKSVREALPAPQRDDGRVVQAALTAAAAGADMATIKGVGAAAGDRSETAFYVLGVLVSAGVASPQAGSFVRAQAEAGLPPAEMESLSLAGAKAFKAGLASGDDLGAVTADELKHGGAAAWDDRLSGVRADSRGAGAEPSRETATKRQAERNAETTTVRSRANAGGTATLPPPAGANGSNGSDHPHNDEHSSDQQDQSN